LLELRLMGSSSSTTSTGATSTVATGKDVLKKKLVTASKTGVLNLADQKLKATSSIWPLLNSEALIPKVKTLDLSGNTLKALPVEVYSLVNLKSLFATRCSLQYTNDMSACVKITTLKLDHNDLEMDKIAPLPPTLHMLNLSSNHLTGIPAVLGGTLMLTKLDVSGNRMESVYGIECLVNLIELVADDNLLVELPHSMCMMVKLRRVSLQRNRIGRNAMTAPEQQSIPAAILVNTSIDHLELCGNPGLRKEDVLKFEGIDELLKRRQEVQDKNLAGGGMMDASLFGLD